MEASVHLLGEALGAGCNCGACHGADARRGKLVTDGEIEALLFLQRLRTPREVRADGPGQREGELPEVIQGEAAVIAIAEVALSGSHASRAVVADEREEARLLLF